jgi:hypothetical protein
MPGYRAHLITAMLIYAVITLIAWSVVIDWSVRILGLLAICVGALFPDIDTKSKGQRYAYTIYALLFGIVVFLYLRHRTQLWIDIIICLAGIMMVPLIVHHRGITHNPRFIILLGLALWLLTAGLYPVLAGQLFFYSICFMCGALSHVWLDRRRIFF